MADIGLGDSFDILHSQTADQPPAEAGKASGKPRAKGAAAPKAKAAAASAASQQQNGKPKAAAEKLAAKDKGKGAAAAVAPADGVVAETAALKKDKKAAAPADAETAAPPARKAARTKKAAVAPAAESDDDEDADVAPAAGAAAPARAQRKREHDVMLSDIQDNEREEGLRRTRYEESRIVLQPEEYAALMAEYGALHAHAPRTRPVPRAKGKIDATTAAAAKAAAAAAAPVPAVLHNDLFRGASTRRFVHALGFRVYGQCISILQKLSVYVAIDIIGRAAKLACPDDQPQKPVIITASLLLKAYIDATRGDTGLTTENVSAMAVTKERASSV